MHRFNPILKTAARRAATSRVASRATLSSASRLAPDVSREPANEAVAPKLARIQTKLFIDGEFRNSISGRTFPTVNPATGEVIAHVQEADAADVDVAVAAARRAFETGEWRTKMTPRDRGACMYRLADLLAKHHDELATLEALDNGKSRALAGMVDAPACAGMTRYWAGWADKITGKTIPVGEDLFCFTRHEPVGVVAAVIPWNLPLIAVAAKLGPALATGNTIVIKTAENTPLSALRFAELVQEAGFPKGVVNILSGFGETAGAALARHEDVDKISFTGSLEVGKKVQEAAARSNLKRVTLELGGKNPSIVFDDADIELALAQVHNGLFWNKGEACAAGTRIFVQDGIYDQFVERATARAKAWRVGHPFHADTDQGAQVSQEQLDKVLGYIRTGVNEGATLLAGGRRVGTKGFYVEPTVFTDVKDSMTIFQEEIFGPVMTLARFSTVEEVIRRANDTKYGLAAGVFTRDIVKGHAVAAGLKSGMVFWNCYHAVDVAAPFGGFKQSGHGREGGEYGLLPYLEVKNVVMRVKP